MKQQIMLGAKSSNWNNVIPASAGPQPEASNRGAKSVESSTAKPHFLTVTALIYERKVAFCLPPSKNKNTQYRREQRSGYAELLPPCSSGFYFDNALPENNIRKVK